MHLFKKKLAKLPKLSKMSPHATKVVAASVVAFLAVGAIVLVAHQATPSVSATPVKAATTSAGVPETTTYTTTVTATAGKPANAKTGVQKPEIVTITGCVEEKNDAFRLTDTGGADAPKSRNWKTLGITKHASSVTLVDSTKRMKLGSHVGERVSVTGTMVDKEMQLKSMKSISKSCE